MDADHARAAPKDTALKSERPYVTFEASR